MSLIQPYAPHVAEELWSRSATQRLWAEPWPVADESLLQRGTRSSSCCQVNGKVRDRVAGGGRACPRTELIALAKASEQGAGAPERPEPRAFVVPDKLVNFVV